ALPALRPRRRASVHDDSALERRSLRRDGAGVVAWVRLLLVGGVLLHVDTDEPEIGDRGEDSRASADDDTGFPGGDPPALVAPLGVRHPGMEHRPPTGKASRQGPATPRAA